MLNAPWLSVILPTYNGEAFLGACLESLISQPVDDLEVIAVDDGSTDDTIAILEHFAGRLPLQILQPNRCANWIRGTNLGLSAARGEYLCFLHQDDVWLPGRASKLRQLSAHWPAAAAIIHPCKFIDVDGRHLGYWRCPFSSNTRQLSRDEVFHSLLVQNFLTVGAPLFKRTTVEQIGVLDESLWFTADWDFWLKLSQAGSWVYCPEVLSGFRLHPLSQTVQSSSHSREHRMQFDKVLARYLSDVNLPQRTVQVARFSAELNIQLAECFHARRLPWAFLLLSGFRLGPRGWLEFYRASRIVERILPRMRLWFSGMLRTSNHSAKFSYATESAQTAPQEKKEQRAA